MTISVGEKIPTTSFPHVPYTPALDDLTACGNIEQYDIAKEWAGKKVVLFATPGAFTPMCHGDHVPGYVQKYDEFKAKGVDVVALIAGNDAFVLSGWGRTLGLKDKIVALSDVNAKWSESIGLSIDLSHRGFGIRTTRYVLVLEDLVVKHIQVEDRPGHLERTGADHVLALL